MTCDYAAFGVAFACFFCAAREFPFPLATGQTGEQPWPDVRGQVQETWEVAGSWLGERVEAGDAAEHPRGPAFTRRWRYTGDGFEASPLMNMANTAMPGSAGSLEHLP